MAIKGAVATKAITPNPSIIGSPPVADDAPKARESTKEAVIGPEATPPESKAIALNMVGQKNNNKRAILKAGIRR